MRMIPAIEDDDADNLVYWSQDDDGDGVQDLEWVHQYENTGVSIRFEEAPTINVPR